MLSSRKETDKMGKIDCVVKKNSLDDKTRSNKIC